MENKIFKAHNHLNKRFGLLKVLERKENDKHKKTMWLCLCDCGNKTIVRGQELVRGETTSCGCYKNLLQHFQIAYTTRTQDYEGRKFGKLEVLELDFSLYRKGTGHYYKCKCDCGNICYASKRHLGDSTKKSCGCLAKENHRTHIRNEAITQICLLCKKEYQTKSYTRKYCSKKCCNKYRNNKYKKNQPTQSSKPLIPIR